MAIRTTINKFMLQIEKETYDKDEIPFFLFIETQNIIWKEVFIRNLAIWNEIDNIPTQLPGAPGGRKEASSKLQKINLTHWSQNL